MAKETKKAKAEEKETKKAKAGYTVSDPEVARPKELPLVIKPNGGEWQNEEQAEYASTLNAYAYANPEKWNEKKDVLLKRLDEIGEKPSEIIKHRGNEGRVSYTNKLLQ